MGGDDAGTEPEWATARSTGGVLLCYGCRELDRCQLGVRAERFDDDGVARFQVMCPPERQGARGVAHGGWTADIFDETLGKWLPIQGKLAPTHSLSVRFRRPVPTSVPLELSVWNTGREGDRWTIEGDLRLCSDGTVLATAIGIFAEVDMKKHFARFKNWMNESSH